uniref:Capsid protein n=1 Tax=viral metagenome TaxID=1070528 RepID=A0A2V0RCC0_9ZZZZ
MDTDDSFDTFDQTEQEMLETVNEILSGLDADFQLTEQDVHAWYSRNWRTTNMSKAITLVENYGIDLKFVAGGGRVIGATIAPWAINTFNSWGEVAAQEVMSIVAGQGNRIRRGGENSIKRVMQGIKNRANATKEAGHREQTVEGTSDGTGDRTLFVNRGEADLAFIPSEIPEVQSTRVVEIPNTTYTKVTITPGKYTTSNIERTPQSAYLAGMQWSLPPSTTYASTFWTNWVMKFQLLAQARTNFSVDATNKFSEANLTSYVNKLSLAISTYLFYANTYTFCALEGKNTARNKLRLFFDTDDMQYLALLKSRLDDLPIPPRLYNELSHLYAIYHTSEHSSTSSTYSFSPMTLFGDTARQLNSLPTSTNTQGIRHCLSNNVLADENFIKTTDMMARVMPEWLDVKVGSSQYSAHMYDADHLNLFINSPGVSSSPDTDSTTVRYNPTYAGDNSVEDKHYVMANAHGKDIRGDQQAMWSCLDTQAPGEPWSGYLVPVTSATGDGHASNRFKYIEGSAGTAKWSFDNHHSGFASGIDVAAGSNIYANTFGNEALQRNTPLGTYGVLGMSTESQRIPQDKYLDFILDIGTPSGDTGKDKKIKYRGKRKK